MRPLTPKQRRFVSEYLKDENATQACIRAGYSKNNAGKIGPELLGKTRVRESVEANLKRIVDKNEVTTERVIRGLLRVAELDIRKAYNPDGSLKNVCDLPDDIALGIAGIEVDEIYDGIGLMRKQIGITKKLRFWDRTKAWEQLGRYTGGFVERREVTGANGEPLMPPAKAPDLSMLTSEEIITAIKARANNQCVPHT